MPETKQAKIAAETRLFYSHWLSVWGCTLIMSELQWDLSLKYDHPSDYREIQELISKSGSHRTNLFDQFYLGIRKDLDAMDLQYENTA